MCLQDKNNIDVYTSEYEDISSKLKEIRRLREDLDKFHEGLFTKYNLEEIPLEGSTSKEYLKIEKTPKEILDIYLEKNGNHPYWMWKMQIKAHYHPGGDAPPIIFQEEELKHRGRWNYPLNCLKRLLTEADDVDKLFKLGDPLKKEEEGGMVYNDIYKYIHNSGAAGKRLKEDPPRYFSRPDTGRAYSGALKRLWYIVNEKGVYYE